MADEILSALQGMQQSPSETYWGIGQQALGQSLPQLIDPVYGDRGTNIGIALGGALVQGLLGYQARQEAADRNLQASQLANALIQLETPEARTSFIGEAPTEFQGGLGTLATALTAQKMQRQAKLAEKLAELETAAQFELGPQGTALFERKMQQEAARQTALTGGFKERQELEDALLRGRALQRKSLGTEDVNVPAAILNRAIEKNESSDLALDVAKTIDTYTSIPEFAAAKSISAFGDDQLKSRLRNLATIVLQSRSGLAATDRERDNLTKILSGDFTAVSPTTVSGLLKRFATDEKTIAADTIAAATQRPEAFVSELRQAIQEGRSTQFEPRVPSYATPATSTTQQPAVKDEKLEILKQLQAELAAEKAKRGIK